LNRSSSGSVGRRLKERSHHPFLDAFGKTVKEGGQARQLAAARKNGPPVGYNDPKWVHAVRADIIPFHADAETLLMSEFQIGKFQVVGKLGAGAQSTILHIRRNADSKHYALKVVPIEGPQDHKYLEQAQHEFRIAQMLDHPSLIKVFALELVKDWMFRVRKVHLLTEYVNGKTLDTCPAIPIPKLVQIFERVAAGLVHMHRRHVYHADIKPNNIMVSRTGDVKIIDFGLARLRGETRGRVQGTPEYMAPEQVKHKFTNERTDIYNFGATMYRMVTWRFPPSTITVEGGLPIDSKTWTRMFTPVQQHVAATPPALCELIHKCLSFHANDRPERMSEVQGTLDHLVDALVQSPEDRLEAMEW
jgi:serine/threonine protein kinase